MSLLTIDMPTAPTATCPPFCTQHFPAADGAPAICHAAEVDGVGVNYSPDQGALITLYEVPAQDITPADARRFAAALLAQADRAEQTAAAFTFPTTR